MGKRALAQGFLPIFLDDPPGRDSSATAAAGARDETKKGRQRMASGCPQEAAARPSGITQASVHDPRRHQQWKLVVRRDAPVALRVRLPTSELTTSERIEVDVVGRSSAGPHESLWRTWCYFHPRW